MKKLILKFSLAFVVVFTMLLTTKHKSTAVSNKYFSFFANNAQMLYLSNAITVTNGAPGVAQTAAFTANATNYWYVGGVNLTNILAGSNFITGTNLLVTGNTTNITTTPQMFSIVPLWADANGDVTTPVISLTINNTNVYIGGNNNNLFSETNVFPLIFVPTATSTNAVTFTFHRGIGPEGRIKWDFTNTFSCTLSNTGVGPLSLLTNPPSSFVQGATWISLYSISSLASTGPGNIISDCGIGGFVP